jgi:hypothetical protein
MRWSPQMSRMVLLLTSQLRPLSPRLLPCTASTGPVERPSRLPLSGSPLCVQRLLGSVCRPSSSQRILLALQENTRHVAHLNLQGRSHYRWWPKKRRVHTLSAPQRRRKRACVDMPKLPQATTLTIINKCHEAPPRGERGWRPWPCES